MEFLVLGAMLVAAIVILIVGGNFCEKYYMFAESYDSSIANIDFNSFHSWYLLNPERYILCKNCIKVKIGSSDYKYELMGFKTFKDWSKYRNFINNKKAESAYTLSTESMLKILNLVQSDIDTARAKIENDRNMAKVEISRALGSH